MYDKWKVFLSKFSGALPGDEEEMRRKKPDSENSLKRFDTTRAPHGTRGEGEPFL